MENLDFNSPSNLLVLSLNVSLIIIIRYFIGSILFEKFFNSARWEKHFVLLNKREHQQKKREIFNSLITSIIFGFFSIILFYLFQHNHTLIYQDLSQYGYWYLPVSLILSMLIHETYYYWLHRIMHHRKIYRIIHKTHHDSIRTSSWTSFSFHPIESFLQVFIFLPIILIVPLHPYMILIQLILMSLSSLVNHCNIELYPKNFSTHALGKWLIGATHHSLHHKNYLTNFGLNFTFWDKVCSTEDKNYLNLFKEKA